ncbi:hypothetical protein HU200_016987 [Digitaria exilis]|uniref:Protein kinase domain-containing protein n=1 Tax=Digitaria exilis TaxID=1010633 RepID=A0A835F797_9POAL|nr:hypothetical protein HU200_016987 [Digitaria exilis]
MGGTGQAVPKIAQHKMRLVVLLSLLLDGAVTATVDGSGGGCNRRCNGLVAPYPLGFSGDGPIVLVCNATASTALLPNGTLPYQVVSFNSMASTFAVSLPTSCDGRTVRDAHASLNTASLGGGYGVSSYTSLFLRGGCDRAAATNAAASCSVSAEIMNNLIDTSRCGNDTTWGCVSGTGNTTAAFLDWERVVASGCEDALTAAVFVDDAETAVPSLEFGVAELGWWLNGTCADATTGGRCAANSTCLEVETPGWALGQRCSCLEGMSGDGFATGDGCYNNGEFIFAVFLCVFDSTHSTDGCFLWQIKVSHLPAVVAGVGSVALLVVGLVVFFCLWKRKRQNNAVRMLKTTGKQASTDGARLFRNKPVNDDDLELDQGLTGPQRFCYEDLAAATGSFSDDRRLGRGGFGSVYHGYLADTNRDGWKEFVAEVRINQPPPALQSRPADRLLLLVYNLMPNGSLDTHLYKHENELTWPVRYGIALGVGATLLYLHKGAEWRMVHRDVKPSNVMLDGSFAAKLGDFGLARLIDDGRRSHTTAASVESDVYNFGVLLLEITCGRRPAVCVVVGDEDEEENYFDHLVQWVWDLYGGRSILHAADARLAGEFDGREMACTMLVGLCLRPAIRKAVNVLQFEAPPPILPMKMSVATYGPSPPADRAGATTSSDESAAVTDEEL